MQGISTFENLVAELSTRERRELLEKIESNIQVSDEPLRNEMEDEEVDLEKNYHLLNLYQRIIVFLKRLFQKKDKLAAVEDLLLVKIARDIERTYPGLLRYKTGEILEPFFNDIKELQEGLSFLVPILKGALGPEKRDFIAFLGSMEVPLIHEQLIQSTDPFIVSEEGVLEADIDVKREIERRMEAIFLSISEDERRILYSDMRILQHLLSLSVFQYERVLSLFSGYRMDKPGSCTLLEIRKPLIELGTLLSGLSLPPSMRLLEGIFLFSVRDKIEREDYDLEKDMKRFTLHADEGLSQIRKFNKSIPILNLLRLSSRNVNYHYEKMGGGEDWFLLYKQFWYVRFNEIFERFTLSRKRTRVTEDAKRFMQADHLPVLSSYRSGLHEDAPLCKYELSLSFLVGFMKLVFLKEMHSHLKMILLDGEFYKEQNRSDFADAYNGLVQSLEAVMNLEKQFAETGDIGTAISEIEKEPIPPPLRRKRLADLYGKGDSAAGEIVVSALKNLEVIGNVLGGILFGEVGGRFDTLSNLGSLGKRDGQNVMVTLGMVHKKLERGFQILKELYDTETSMS